MANLKLNKKETKIEVQIIEDGEKWASLIEKAKKSLIENLEIKGFRKGHVPSQIAEKYISESQVWNKAADLLIESEYSNAIELLTKEQIATRPKFVINSISNESIDASLFSFVVPKIKIGDINKIEKIEYKVEEISEDELEKELKNLDDLLKTLKETDNKIAKDGDTVNIDFLGKINGEAFEGGESKDYDLKLGSNQFINGFEPQIVGMEKGQTKEIVVTFPQTYPEAKLSNKEAVFTVTLNSIKNMVELEGEELKEKLNSLGFSSKEEVINKIKEVIKNRKEEEADEKFFRKYINEILKLPETEVLISDEVLKDQIEEEFKRVEAQIVQQNMKMNDYLKMVGQTIEEFKEKNLKESSRKRITDGLIYSKLIEKLNIKVFDEEIEKEFEKLANNAKSTIEEVKKQIKKESIEGNLIFKKLIEALK
ncbi:MAG: trigger factor [Candidatus Tyloplasma litorale]|nr:MAG: trigger factor [Mycoplasmatales bacterium]